MTSFIQRLNSCPRPRLFLWVALLVIIPRLVFVLAAPGRNIYGNAPGMLIIANNLVSGNGYLGEDGKPDAYYNPGYPCFLAACRLVGGPSLWPVKLAQIALDVAAALALAWLLAEVAPLVVVWVFAIAFAWHPLLLHLGNNVNDEPLLTCLVTLGIVCLYQAMRKATATWYAVAAVLVTLATYTKGTAIFLPFAAAGLVGLFARQKLWHLLLYLALYIALLLPWAYRNYVTFGHFAFSTRGFGNALFFGSDPKIFANSDIIQQRQAAADLEKQMEAKGLVRPARQDMFESEKWKFRMGIENYKEMLLERPGHLLWVVYMKMTRGLYATENRRAANMLILALQIPALIFGGIGFWRMASAPTARRVALVLGICFGYFYLINAAGEPIVRYFVPALPALLAAAAVGLTMICNSQLNHTGKPGTEPLHPS